jgi:hypothetical protein
VDPKQHAKGEVTTCHRLASLSQRNSRSNPASPARIRNDQLALLVQGSLAGHRRGNDMAANVRVTIVLEYESESVGTNPAKIDQEAFNEGQIPLPELLEWCEDGPMTVKFETI